MFFADLKSSSIQNFTSKVKQTQIKLKKDYLQKKEIEKK